MNGRTGFPSKRDAWLVLFIWAGAILAVVGAVAQFDSRAPLLVRALLLVVLLAAAAFMLWVLYGTAYAVGRDELLVRCGPFRFKVRLGDIESVTPSRNPLSSPACSLDRLYIRLRGSRVGLLVSPEDKRGFLAALVERCPHLALAGDRVVGRGPTSGGASRGA